MYLVHCADEMGRLLRPDCLPLCAVLVTVQKAKNESDDLAQPASFEFEVTELHKAIVGLHGEMVQSLFYYSLVYRIALYSASHN